MWACNTTYMLSRSIIYFFAFISIFRCKRLHCVGIECGSSENANSCSQGSYWLAQTPQSSPAKEEAHRPVQRCSLTCSSHQIFIHPTNKALIRSCSCAGLSDCEVSQSTFSHSLWPLLSMHTFYSLTLSRQITQLSENVSFILASDLLRSSHFTLMQSHSLDCPKCREWCPQNSSDLLGSGFILLISPIPFHTSEWLAYLNLPHFAPKTWPGRP